MLCRQLLLSTAAVSILALVGNGGAGLLEEKFHFIYRSFYYPDREICFLQAKYLLFTENHIIILQENKKNLRGNRHSGEQHESDDYHVEVSLL